MRHPRPIPWIVKNRLKTWPEHFAQAWNGFKKFELRIDDRDFTPGDCVSLDEWDPMSKTYSGRSLVACILYVLRNRPDLGLADGYCIFCFDTPEKFNWKEPV